MSSIHKSAYFTQLNIPIKRKSRKFALETMVVKHVQLGKSAVLNVDGCKLENSVDDIFSEIVSGCGEREYR